MASCSDCKRPVEVVSVPKSAVQAVLDAYGKYQDDGDLSVLRNALIDLAMVAGIEAGQRDPAALAEVTTPEAMRLMVRDRDDGKMFTITNVEVETHDDADGSRTVWLTIEEY